MRKKQLTQNLEQTIVEKISSNTISMKPKWHFVLGSVVMGIGLVATTLLAVFLFSLSLFLLRQHGPNGAWRLSLLIQSFPLWIPILAFCGIYAGIRLLKTYDFSYRKNFLAITIGFIGIILITGFFLDMTGLDDLWLKRGPIRNLYQSTNSNTDTVSPSRYGRIYNGNRFR